MKFYDHPGKRNVCGDRIREARLRQRLSQTDLCRKLQLVGIGMNRDCISKIESGDRFVLCCEATCVGYCKDAW